jgi:hypothetical protein
MRIVLIATALTLTLSTAALAQTRQAQPSGRGMTRVTLVDSRENPPTPLEPKSITVDYGQPHLRGRALHTGDLVPYDQVWRTGANDVTTFTTGVDLMLGGAHVPAGRYFLFTLPSRTGWKLILQKDNGQPPMRYDVANDLVRVDLRRRELPMAVESLTMWLIPATGATTPRGEFRIMWGNMELATDWMVH